MSANVCGSLNILIMFKSVGRALEYGVIRIKIMLRGGTLRWRLVRGNLSVSDAWESKYSNLIPGNFKLLCLVIDGNI